MLLQLTRHCSTCCPHCMLSAIPDDNHMDRITLIQTLKFIKKSGATVLNVAGGEPTEHPNFFNMFEQILNHKFKCVILTTNGKWLFDETFVNRLANLQKKKIFFIQVSAFTDIYPEAAKTQEQFKLMKNRLNNIEIITEPTEITLLGRAKKGNWDKYQKRIAPACFNFLVGAKYVAGTFKKTIHFLESKGKFCMPLIGWDGTIYTSEYVDCIVLGNVSDYSFSDIFKKLQAQNPCGKCVDNDNWKILYENNERVARKGC